MGGNNPGALLLGTIIHIVSESMASLNKRVGVCYSCKEVPPGQR